MISLVFAIVAKLIWFCQTFFPSNIVLRYFRRRDRLKWGALVGLAGAAVYYGLFLFLSTGQAYWGWQAWAHLVGIPVVLSLVKFVVFIPVSAILLAWYRLREATLLREVNRDLRRRANADGRAAAGVHRRAARRTEGMSAAGAGASKLDSPARSPLRLSV